MEKGAPRVRGTEYGVRSVSSSNDPSLRTPYSVLRTLFRPLSPLPSPLFPLHFFLLLNTLGLLAVATWLRCHALGNVPGVNGDEAWYGVRAWWLLHGGPYGGWHTPTGNPLNPLFVGPLALLHLWLPPSIALLRSVAVAGGLAALAINWLLCRWVFDRRTAAISTLLLAVLPINIAYSRFAWDASQSLAATLPVVYLALAAVRFPERFGRWIAAAILAQAVAVWVHPTNVVAGAVIAIACLAQWRNRNDAKENDEARMTNDEFPSSFVIRHSSFIIWSLACLVLASWIGLASLKGGLLAGHTAERLANIRQSAPPTQLPAVVLYPRLFTGGTTYRYIAGSRSWFEWPLPADLDGWGLDVGVFWLCVFGSAWLLWRGNRDSRLGLSNRVLLAAWALTIAAFMLIGGPQAMAPGQERFALCLVAPTDHLAGPRGVAGLGGRIDAVARRFGSGHAGRLAACGRFPRPLLPFHRALWRPGAPRVPHRGGRTEASRPASDPGGKRRSAVDHLPAMVESLADSLLGTVRSRRSRAGSRGNRSFGRLSAGVGRRAGVVCRVLRHRRVAAGRIATGPPKANPLAISRLRPPARPLRAPCRRRVTSTHSLQSLRWGRHSCLPYLPRFSS